MPQNVASTTERPGEKGVLSGVQKRLDSTADFGHFVEAVSFVSQKLLASERL